MTVDREKCREEMAGVVFELDGRLMRAISRIGCCCLCCKRGAVCVLSDVGEILQTQASMGAKKEGDLR